MTDRARRVAVAYATDFGSLSPGGIQSFIRVVGRHAAASVDVVYLGMGDLRNPLPRTSDRFVSLGAAPPKGRVNAAFTKALRRHAGLLEDVDTVVVHRPEHVLALDRRPDRRLALMLHGGTWNAWRARPGAFGASYAFLEALAAGRAEVTIAVAPAELSRATRWAGRVEALPTTYDDELFRASGAAEVRSDRRRRLLLVGRLVSEKRFDIALRAAAAVSADLEQVDVFGDGPERASLVAQAAQLGLRTQFHGMAPPDVVAAAHHGGTAVLVLTSRFEGFPVAALEAAASGTPVVALDAPGVSAPVRAMGGVVVPTEEDLPAALRAALRRRHEPDAAAVAASYGTRAVARRFWSLALGVPAGVVR